MNKIQNIKVLFWDIDNTLLDFDAGAEDSMKQAFADLGLKFKPEMFDVFRKKIILSGTKSKRVNYQGKTFPMSAGRLY